MGCSAGRQVKLLRPEYAGHAEGLARFRAEERRAARLTHPGIVQVYDYGRDPAGLPLLVMELSMGRRWPACWPGPDVRVPGAGHDRPGGRRAGHGACGGQVHRDIKPAILLLAPGSIVKITTSGSHPRRGRPADPGQDAGVHARLPGQPCQPCQDHPPGPRQPAGGLLHRPRQAHDRTRIVRYPAGLQPHRPRRHAMLARRSGGVSLPARWWPC